MKIKLLNDAAYGDMGSVVFPVEVEAEPSMTTDGTQYGWAVSGEELERIGGDKGTWAGVTWFWCLEEVDSE